MLKSHKFPGTKSIYLILMKKCMLIICVSYICTAIYLFNIKPQFLFKRTPVPHSPEGFYSELVQGSPNNWYGPALAARNKDVILNTFLP